MKPPTSLLEPDGKIIIPEGAGNMHYEGELVVVIGRKTKEVSKEEATGCIFGYTCGNGLSERDWQKGDLQWWHAKGPIRLRPWDRQSLSAWIIRPRSSRPA